MSFMFSSRSVVTEPVEAWSLSLSKRCPPLVEVSRCDGGGYIPAGKSVIPLCPSDCVVIRKFVIPGINIGKVLVFSDRF